MFAFVVDEDVDKEEHGNHRHVVGSDETEQQPYKR